MINITAWLSEFLKSLNKCFGERIWFVGLQGSYGRGEATETSDIDIVVILDKMTVADIKAYDSMLEGLPHRSMICGFLSGKQEILNWAPSDLFQFYHDTTPIVGTLDELLLTIDETAVNDAIKIGVCNIYHGCMHNMLHEKSDEILKGLYKSASFVVQAICYKQTGHYIRRQDELLNAVAPSERVILDTFLRLKNGDVDFQKMSAYLFDWCQKCITEIS